MNEPSQGTPHPLGSPEPCQDWLDPNWLANPASFLPIPAPENPKPLEEPPAEREDRWSLAATWKEVRCSPSTQPRTTCQPSGRDATGSGAGFMAVEVLLVCSGATQGGGCQAQNALNTSEASCRPPPTAPPISSSTK